MILSKRTECGFDGVNTIDEIAISIDSRTVIESCYQQDQSTGDIAMISSKSVPLDSPEGIKIIQWATENA